MRKVKQTGPYLWRFRIVVTCLMLVMGVITWRIIDLHVIDRQFLQDQGDKRTVRYTEIAATRGIIFDRNGEPLAVSTPVKSFWGNPKELVEHKERWPVLADTLGIKRKTLAKRVLRSADKEFIYLRRHLTPKQGGKVVALDIPGVYAMDEFRRYYPASEVVAHLIGFTNIDGQGQEGIELAYSEWLDGKPGKVRLLKDRRGRLIEQAQSIKSAEPGKELMLSIDMRIQYYAYRSLKEAIKENEADSGSVVVLDVTTGEVLAMVNNPSYNPNNRKGVKVSALRNRAVTDVFEPGSTMKAFTVAAALETGKYTPDTKIDVRPGYIMVGRKTVKDHRNYGVIDLTTVLTKSSNVGTTKIAQDIGVERIWSLLSRVGFGESTGVGFPGERSGTLPVHTKWRPVEIATLSYGYGLSSTPLQVAQAYMVLASGGIKRPISLLKVDDPSRVEAQQVLPKKVAKQVVSMLTTVIERGGTGTRAKVDSYTVAGKTGTVHKVGAHGYEEKKYMSIFAGMAPASNPRVVTVVMINNPKAGKYYGGAVAAPIFSNVTAGALRMLGVPPDNMPAVAKQEAKPGIKDKS
ncbi:peptidoglycan D,D-transpeptidase FtsI family protein [Zooshikella harenae]|uniref:Peptidoglycan D,D-transpeptidase FtsI n=1 Tax=Zooshikella harenae TaxID=2827238 RepID=A0ABS5Z852_9GAMM|nr:penicillin-binding transpeptidase domain-containing protein [Zooshikella harenae]MBU2710222.1 penicillin-binding protein 2 [Zooshikella harenae]